MVKGKRKKLIEGDKLGCLHAAKPIFVMQLQTVVERRHLWTVIS